MTFPAFVIPIIITTTATCVTGHLRTAGLATGHLRGTIICLPTNLCHLTRVSSHLRGTVICLPHGTNLRIPN